MAGQGHQFPGNFGNSNPTGMRNNYGSGPMGAQMPGMPNQMPGVMGGPMSNPNQMVSMGNQMVPQYNASMQNQMGNMGMQQATAECAMVSPLGGGSNMGNLTPAAMQSPVRNIGTPIMQTSNVTTVPATPSPASTNPPQPPVQNKEFNTASLCKIGQETVQDIVSRTQDVFQTLKTIQPPNGTSQGAMSSNEKKTKMQEQLRTIRLLFKRLRLIYEKCNDQLPGMEYTHIESLIPLKDEQDNKNIEDTKNTEAYKLALEENRELVEQVVLKNKQLKEVINNLRTIIWEINVMLNMRRS